jgi:hypothetical protein
MIFKNMVGTFHLKGCNNDLFNLFYHYNFVKTNFSKTKFKEKEKIASTTIQEKNLAVKKPELSCV